MNILKKNDIEYFKGIPKIKYEGKKSKNPLAFKWYDADKVVSGKPMKDHFKFAVAYWHSFCNTGGDPFGIGTKNYPWAISNDPYINAKTKMDAAFEFMSKLSINHYCFHDVDIIDDTDDLVEFNKRLNYITDYAQKKQQEFDIQLLWGTANLFSHPRYMNGAATNPDFNVVARAGAQVKAAIDATIKLDGQNYVFWGGREGYTSLLNTQMKRELDHLGVFLNMAKDYARKNGFKGWFFIEPKPMEPSKHQYDFDAATCVGFLREYGLENDFKLNIEVNHATLAQHTFEHELQVAADAGMLGSIDANRGDYQNGWDTDQFPINLFEITKAMMVTLESGGLGGGGVNFDAKTRRNSTDLLDLFYAHIGSMDIFAKALLLADKILSDSNYLTLKNNRYRSFNSGRGKKFEQGKLSLNDLHDSALQNGKIELESGRQEMFENLINDYLLR